MEDIDYWVSAADSIEEEKFRKAMSLILLAIARDKSLSQNLVVKGGIALSIVYSSERYTTDLDLSCLDDISNLSKENLESSLNRQLKAVSALSDYNIEFLIHSIKQRPKDALNSRFPAYKIKIGYADRSIANEMRRLENKQASHIVELDISFNEGVTLQDTTTFKLTNNQNVLCYSTEQLLAEKYRSILQQTVRNRNRRQDIYDIYYLLSYDPQFFSQESTKRGVLNKLFKSSVNKGIEEHLHREGLRDEDIKARSLEDFHTLLMEIDIDEDPEIMYRAVQEYYESLPWSDS